MALLWTGCGAGTNLCDRFTLVNLSLLDKAKACSNVSFTLMSRATCDEAIKSCNTNDLALLSSHLDCLDHSVGTCVAGQENIYFGSISLCDGLLAGMSNTCKSAGFGPR